jgi:hypothetical protein
LQVLFSTYPELFSRFSRRGAGVTLMGFRLRPMVCGITWCPNREVLVLEVRKDSLEDGQLIAAASEEKENLYLQ